MLKRIYRAVMQIVRIVRNVTTVIRAIQITANTCRHLAEAFT